MLKALNYFIERCYDLLIFNPHLALYLKTRNQLKKQHEKIIFT